MWPKRTDYWSDKVLKRRLGQGAFGVVYLVEDASGAEKVLKQYKKVDESTETEIATLRALNTSGLAERCGLSAIGEVALIPAWQGRTLMLSVELDYRRGQDLKGIVKRQRLSPDQSLVIAKDLLQSLACLHGAALVHRDVKMENVIWDEGRAHLIDYGDICRTPLADDALEAVIECDENEVSTRQYRAPELFERTPFVSTASSDIWALGVLLWETMINERVDVGSRRQALSLSAKAQRMGQLLHDQLLPRMVASMLRADPSSRPSAEELLKQLS